MAIEDGDTPANINMAIVGGFRFDSPDDPQALEVRRNITAHGVDAAVMAVTGLQKSHPLVRQTVAGYRLADLMV
jgi:hypothetical protein